MPTRARPAPADRQDRQGAGESGESGASGSPRQITISTVMEFTDFGTDVEAGAPPAGRVADVTDQAARQGRKHS